MSVEGGGGYRKADIAMQHVEDGSHPFLGGSARLNTDVILSKKASVPF